MKVRVSITKTARIASDLGMDPVMIQHALEKQRHESKRIRRKLGRNVRQGG